MTTKQEATDPASTSARFIRVLRTISPDMPMQQAEVLIAIANKPGITMSDLAKRTGLSQSSISRNIAALSKFHRIGKPGLDLVEAVTDPRETRRRLVYLTTNGKMHVTKLFRVFDENYSIDKDTDARLEVMRMHEEALAKAEPNQKGRAAVPKG